MVAAAAMLTWLSLHEGCMALFAAESSEFHLGDPVCAAQVCTAQTHSKSSSMVRWIWRRRHRGLGWVQEGLQGGLRFLVSCKSDPVSLCAALLATGSFCDWPCLVGVQRQQKEALFSIKLRGTESGLQSQHQLPILAVAAGFQLQKPFNFKSQVLPALRLRISLSSRPCLSLARICW